MIIIGTQNEDWDIELAEKDDRFFDSHTKDEVFDFKTVGGEIITFYLVRTSACFPFPSCYFFKWKEQWYQLEPLDISRNPKYGELFKDEIIDVIEGKSFKGEISPRLNNLTKLQYSKLYSRLGIDRDLFWIKMGSIGYTFTKEEKQTIRSYVKELNELPLRDLKTLVRKKRATMFTKDFDDYGFQYDNSQHLLVNKNLSLWIHTKDYEGYTLEYINNRSSLQEIRKNVVLRSRNSDDLIKEIVKIRDNNSKAS
ncbi:hypothetical protein TH61_00510 [Rufibacter sp. DG15C]|uniref:hypothetical protein n=1 Tax=Rufibacter sp. DG15C TaxID=1379909 RepID=UPI00078B92D5|nr:hypothetical protein [Rufibacter sp. DG15C]AMM49961.1 hypothetical protein TH61_00510 [Rufibacter sp. DG15C]